MRASIGPHATGQPSRVRLPLGDEGHMTKTRLQAGRLAAAVHLGIDGLKHRDHRLDRHAVVGDVFGCHSPHVEKEESKGQVDGNVTGLVAKSFMSLLHNGFLYASAFLLMIWFKAESVRAATINSSHM